jgi:ATP synthase protein I
MVTNIRPKKSDRHEIARAFALLTQIGIIMVVTIGLGFFIGLFLDEKLGTSPTFLIVFIIIGALSAIRNMYVIVSKTWEE